ncbi:MAG: oligosaccharide flippase family protein [Burkholderiales bacterium]
MRLRVLRAGAIYSVANALSAGVSFLLLPVLTRALSPSDYGVVISFFLLASLSSSIAGLSVHGAVSVRWFDRHSGDFPRFVGTAVSLAIGSTAICGLTLFCAAFLLQAKLELSPVFWFLAAINTGASVVLGIRTALWQSQGAALFSAVLQVSMAVLNVALSLIAVFVLSMGGEGRIFGAVTSGVFSAALAIWFLIRTGDAEWAVGKSDLSALLRFGLPLVPHSIAGVLLVTVDRFSVAALLGREALGIYGTAAQIGMAMSILGDAIVKASSPWMFKQMASRTTRAHLRVVGAAYLMIPVWLLVAVALWLVLKGAGPLILDRRYLPAIELSLWFLLGGAANAVYLNIAGLFFFTSKNEWLSIATVSSAVAAALLAPAFTTAWGLTGAALSFLCTQLIFLTLAWALSLRVQPMPWNRPSLAMRALARSLKER